MSTNRMKVLSIFAQKKKGEPEPVPRQGDTLHRIVNAKEEVCLKKFHHYLNGRGVTFKFDFRPKESGKKSKSFSTGVVVNMNLKWQPWKKMK